MVSSVDAMSREMDGPASDDKEGRGTAPSKRARRRQRQKQARQELRAMTTSTAPEPVANGDADVEVVYVPDKIESTEPLAQYFSDVFERFSSKGSAGDEPEVIVVSKDDDEAGGGSGGSDDEKEEIQLSHRQLRKLNRMAVSELKQAAAFPEVVDVHDVCTSDPVLLVQLKSVRNSVPVPGHWSQKRKYLQGKRGQEKSAFKLPDFIEATGIGKIRQAQIEADADKKMKTKQRERMQPKMNRIDIDYQVTRALLVRGRRPPADCVLYSSSTTRSSGTSPRWYRRFTVISTTKARSSRSTSSRRAQASCPLRFARRLACAMGTRRLGSSTCSGSAHRRRTGT